MKFQIRLSLHCHLICQIFEKFVSKVSKIVTLKDSWFMFSYLMLFVQDIYMQGKNCFISDENDLLKWIFLECSLSFAVCHFRLFVVLNNASGTMWWFAVAITHADAAFPSEIKLLRRRLHLTIFKFLRNDEQGSLD